MDRLSRVPRLLLFGVVAIYLLLPVTAIALYSFATSWTAHALPDGYTLAHWESAFNNSRLLSALGRTFLLALAVLLLDGLHAVEARGSFGQQVKGTDATQNVRAREHHEPKVCVLRVDATE